MNGGDRFSLGHYLDAFLFLFKYNKTPEDSSIHFSSILLLCRTQHIDLQCKSSFFKIVKFLLKMGWISMEIIQNEKQKTNKKQKTKKNQSKIKIKKSNCLIFPIIYTLYI